MANMSDFFQALGMFEAATKEYGVVRGIDDATQAIQKIKNEELDVIKQREAQTDIANQLQARLTALGAPASQIATAVGAVTPEKLLTASDYARKFAETGKQEYADLRDEVAKNEGVIKRAQMEPTMQLEQDFQAKEKQKDRNLQWDMALLQNERATGDRRKEAKAGEVSFSTNLQMAGNFINELKTAVKESGTYESEWVGDTKNAAILKQTPYKLAITYAKIVDPDSVAREGEVAAAQKYLIELGATRNKKAVLAQIDQMAQTINQYKEGRQAATGKPINVPDIKTSSGSRVNQNAQKMINVRMPNGNTGQVLESQWDAFLAKYPGAKRQD